MSALLGLVLLGQVPPVIPPAAPKDPATLEFTHRRIDDDYISEGVGVADLDADGDLDVTSGARWYVAPDFDRVHSILPVGPYSITSYSDVFHVFTEDLDLDGHVDVLVQSFPSWPCVWMENPGTATAPWKQHVLFPGVDGEHPILTDLTGDGNRDLVFASQGRLGYASRQSDPYAPWTFHPISPDIGYTTFSHGLGVGDVNGDGRPDVLFPLGYYEQPPALQGDPVWNLHPHNFGGPPGGSHMFAYDADGDGDHDVISAANSHGYGLTWFEQTPGPPPSSEVFKPRAILPVGGSWRFGVQVSQLHGAALGDIDGDGVPDFVSGKSFFAHNGLDPGAFEPAYLIAFLTRRTAAGATYEPVVIHPNSGIGRRIVVVDLDRDGRTDVVHAGKKGVWVHLQRD